MATATAKKSAKAKKGSGGNWGGISGEAVRKATGCDWETWLYVLDKSGCAEMAHKEIAELIAKRWPKIGGWWSQMVTVGYEQARGLRVMNQTTAGWQVSSSKTVSVPVKTLFAAWKDPKKRAAWLKDNDFTVRKATEPKSMRISWVDGKTTVEANFYAKGKGKSYVALQHNKLSGRKEVEKLRAYWTKALGAMKARLEA
ncbi:MAG: hypothetical protein ACKVXR_09505 [Planctomycetota bacterium]